MLTVHNFSYGLLTPVLGYMMSCMGAFLGLRCTTRAFAYRGWARVRWLLFAGVSIGITGIWAMHFIAMLGFTIPGETIHYNVPITILSMFIAVGIVCAGLLIVGFGGTGYGSLLLAGLVTGFGVASMHYMGMAAMRMYRAAGPAGMVMGGSGGATAESFLLPLILGISVLSFISIATIALSPNSDEIRTESDLMDRIGRLGSQAR
jgi:NO-binding membrane sensor protein with MHYT domain